MNQGGCLPGILGVISWILGLFVIPTVFITTNVIHRASYSLGMWIPSLIVAVVVSYMIPSPGWWNVAKTVTLAIILTLLMFAFGNMS